MNMATLAPWLAVAGGGAVGASLRFATTLWIGVPTMPTWPWATFGVNLVGSFLFGFLAVALASLPPLPANGSRAGRLRATHRHHPQARQS